MTTTDSKIERGVVNDDVPSTEAAKPYDGRGLEESSDGDKRCFFLVEGSLAV